MNIDDKADKVLNSLSKVGQDYLVSLTKEVVGEYAGFYADFIVIENALVNEGLVVRVGVTDAYNITAKGRRVVELGGYKKYIEDARSQDEEEKEHKKHKRTKDYWQSKIAKWQVFLFWPIFIFALLGAAGNAEKTWDLFQKLMNTNIEHNEEIKASTPLPQPQTDSLRNE